MTRSPKSTAPPPEESPPPSPQIARRRAESARQAIPSENALAAFYVRRARRVAAAPLLREVHR